MSLWPDIRASLDGVYLVRHAWLTFGGTWGVPGTGYCSWVVQAAIDNDAPAYEIPVPGPYSFGPIPAINQGLGITAPSYRESIDISVEWAINWLLAHPLQTFGLAGYSQGGEAASRVLKEVIYPDGRLYHLKDNFIGGFTFGNPCREKGHTYPGGIDPGGRGISDFNLTNTPVEWHDHANGTANGAMGDDLYTTRHDGQVGEDEQDVYQMAIDLQLHDFMGFIKSMLQHLMDMIQDLGGMPYLLTQIGTGAVFGSAFQGILAGLIPGFGGGGIGGLLGGVLGGTKAAPVVTNDRIEAAVEAAMIGLKFLFQGTGPHVTYESTPALPNNPMTHLQHAVGHVIDRSYAVTARQAA